MTLRDFDSRAKTWDDDPVKAERANVVAAALDRELPRRPSMRALEYGCGTGSLSFALRSRFARITLADVSDGMIKVAREKIAAAGETHMEAVRLDLLTDPPPEQRFDVIYSLMTLHHIPDTEGILCRFHNVLARRGYLCIADLDSEDGSFHGEGFDGHHGFDRDALAAMTRRAGFATVHFSTAYEMSKTVEGTPRVFPVFLMVAGTV